MLYFLTSADNSTSKHDDLNNGQKSSQTFSRINLIATTPKGFALLTLGMVVGVLVIALLSFALGYDAGKSSASHNRDLATAPRIPVEIPPISTEPNDKNAPKSTVPDVVLRSHQPPPPEEEPTAAVRPAKIGEGTPVDRRPSQ